TITNAATGTIEALANNGGGRYLNCNLINQGAIIADAGTSIPYNGYTFTSSGGSLSGAIPFTNSIFNLTSGTLASPYLSFSTFNFNGGSVSGTVTLVASDLSIATSNAAHFLAQSSGTLHSNLAAGQVVTVQGDATWGNATLYVPDGWANSGTFYLDSD